MIEYVRMRNFKCFDDAAVAVNQLTVLSGLNGAGKSSVIQALLLLRQSGVQSGVNPATLRWQGELVDLGSFTDVLYEDADEDSILLESTFQSGGIISVEVGRTDTGDQRLIENTGFQGASDSSLYRWPMYYLGAERLGPRKTLPLLSQGPESGTPLGARGEHVLWFLERYGTRLIRDCRRIPGAPKDTLAGQVTAWLSVVSPGVDVNVAAVRNADLAFASYAFSRADSPTTRAFRSTNVGFGLSYALPVIVALLAAEEDDLVMIENPEAHLHPGGQTKVAELAARTAATGAQVILETHSDHILNGIRLAVRNAIIKPEQATLHYFRKEDLAIRIETPVIGADGRLDSWPDGFFDQHERNLAALIAGREE